MWLIRQIIEFLFLLLASFCDLQIEKNQSMEKEEFDILSRRIRPKLLSVARSFIAVEGGLEAEDIVQETLLALWELAEQDYPIRDAESLSVRIAKNICISHYRKAHLDTRSLAHDNYTGGTEATILTDKEDLKVLKKSLFRSLTDTQKEYLHLRNDREMSLDEIARLTGKPKTSIKSTLSAARKQMLELIKKQL